MFKLLILFMCVLFVSAFAATFEHLTDELNEQGVLMVSSTSGLNEANRMIKIAASSYCVPYPNKSLENWTCDACKASGITMTDVIRLHAKKTDGNGYVGYNKSEKKIVITFQGSKTAKNWMTNLNFLQTKYSGCTGCKVHRGFLKAYNALRPQLLAALEKLLKKYPGSKIAVTGHSLGGALAGHALLDLKSGSFKAATVQGKRVFSNGNANYDLGSNALLAKASTAATSVKFSLNPTHHTFGQPRLGNAEFAKFWFGKFRASVFRHTNNADPVPHLPPSTLGFQHPTQEVWWKKNVSKICSGTNGEDKTCSRGQINLKISDHMTYIGYKISGDAANCK